MRFEVTLTKEQWAKFKQARDILSTALPKGSAWSQVIEYLCDNLIAKKQKAAPKLARPSVVSSSAVKKIDINASPQENRKARTAVPKSIQRDVFARDGCCQFQSRITGYKCASTFNLTLDHIQPIWAGGSHSVDNLRVYRAAHNAAAYRAQAGIFFA